MVKAKKQNLKKYIGQLFILVSFPIHVWSIYQTFNNLGWVAERTRWWDAVGYGAYAMMYALIESALVFLVILPVFLMLAKNRPPEKALAIAGMTYFTLVLLWIFRAIMINNTRDEFFLDSFINDLADEGKWRKRYRWGAVLLAAGVLNIPVVAMPFLTGRSEKLVSFVRQAAARFEILMYLLFGMDMLAIILVIVRNIQGAL